MVSLAAVEGYVNEVWPENMHAVVAVPDERKGEQLVLVTDNENAERQSLISYAKSQGIAELMIPRVIKLVQSLPVLGTGKIDLVSIKRLIGDQDQLVAAD